MLATLYDVSLPTINEHIKNIFSDSELDEDSTIRNFRIVQNKRPRHLMTEALIKASGTFALARFPK